ncbi:hypothetical protein F511_22449 [Dorcoceras hygrometricum]|uniref:BHLH domain-containing protein n=1 Tax=Dorcoceras hygrometricum TaxID=472368 RepID=A0A2Z7APL4_9LAMI|nr:hypothetical protein F511_22449 [Dorcoceras hygrometricum]
MDDPSFFHQWPVVSIVDLKSVSYGSPFAHEDPHNPFSLQPVPDHERALESTQHESSKPLKLITSSTPSGAFHFIDEGISRPKMEAWTLDFPSESVVSESSTFGEKNYVVRACERAKRVSSNIGTKDSVLAERKRREKLSQRFIDLSALVPGLKKMDKASVLGDAIKYTKQLQERVKILEHQTKIKSIESVVFVKKHLHCSDSIVLSETLPEIEARFSDNDVLINVQCERRNGLLERTVAEIERHHLTVVNSSAMSFGHSALYIVVMAKKDEDCGMNTKEVVQNLCTSLETLLK